MPLDLSTQSFDPRPREARDRFHVRIREETIVAIHDAFRVDGAGTEVPHGGRQHRACLKTEIDAGGCVGNEGDLDAILRNHR